VVEVVEGLPAGGMVLGAVAEGGCEAVGVATTVDTGLA
jgi:hypothetical protein